MRRTWGVPRPGSMVYPLSVEKPVAIVYRMRKTYLLSSVLVQHSLRCIGSNKIMKREVVQEFLGLPSIVGLALMDGRSRPCFYGVSERLNLQQREALAQGLCQVLETTPSSFKTFEFQFSGVRAYVYKLTEGLVLLVVVDNALSVAEYREVFKTFKQTLEDNVGSAISTLRYLAGAQTSSNRARASGGTATQGTSTQGTRNLGLMTGGLRTGSTISSSIASGRTSTGQQSGRSSAQSNRGQTPEVGILKEYFLGINQLSSFAKKYLGTAVIVNYWKSSRPQVKWLEGFQIDRSGNVTCLAENTQLIQQPVSTQQQEWLRDWVQSFIKRCSTVIRDFPNLAEAEAFSPEQKRLFPFK
ncbi:MAG: hypothetical protein RLZZ435_1583 [Cyanobacteriota bacterium]